MSNSEGSYVLYVALQRLSEKGIFDHLSQIEMQALFREMMDALLGCWCEEGKIFWGWLEKYGLCRHCLEVTSQFDEGSCLACLE